MSGGAGRGRSSPASTCERREDQSPVLDAHPERRAVRHGLDQVTVVRLTEILGAHAALSPALPPGLGSTACVAPCGACTSGPCSPFTRAPHGHAGFRTARPV